MNKYLIVLFLGFLLASCSMMEEQKIIKLSDLTFPESLLQPTEISNQTIKLLEDNLISYYCYYGRQYSEQSIKNDLFGKLNIFKTLVENNTYLYESDLKNFNIEDKWQLPENFLLSKKGDCEEISASFAWLAYLMLGDNSPYVLVSSYLTDGSRHMWVKNIYNSNDNFNKTGKETKDIYQITIKQYLAIAYNLDNDSNVDIFVNNQ